MSIEIIATFCKLFLSVFEFFLFWKIILILNENESQEPAVYFKKKIIFLVTYYALQYLFHPKSLSDLYGFKQESMYLIVHVCKKQWCMIKARS